MRLNEEQLQLVDSILNVLEDMIPSKFGRETSDFSQAMFDIEERLLEDYHVYCASGASKFVIIPDELPVVIKIPLTGYWYNPYDVGDTDDERCDLEFECYCEGGGPNHDDYCATEVDMYEKAIEANVDDIFAETVLYTTKHNFLVYLQEKVTTCSDTLAITPSKESMAKVSQMRSSQQIASEDWCASVIDYYGEDFYWRLQEFVTEMQPDIGADLHDGNVGFCGSIPMILDYSGFNN